MHVEPEKHPPGTLKEFATHYAMIVISILTALLLEQVALSVEHAREGRQAKVEIEREIRTNQVSIREAAKLTDVNLTLWNDLLQKTVADVKAKQGTNDTRLAALVAAGREFHDSLPPLKTSAWDTAISDHAVNYMDHEDMSRYSELYAAQRMLAQTMWDTVRDTAVRNMSDMSVALYMSNAEPLETLRVLDLRVKTLSVIASDLRQLDAAMTDALKAE